MFSRTFLKCMIVIGLLLKLYDVLKVCLLYINKIYDYVTNYPIGIYYKFVPNRIHVLLYIAQT